MKTNPEQNILFPSKLGKLGDVAILNCGQITVITGFRQTGKTCKLIQNMLLLCNSRFVDNVYILTHNKNAEYFFKQDVIKNSLNSYDDYRTLRENVKKESDAVFHDKIGTLPIFLKQTHTNDINKLILVAKNASEFNKVRIYVDDCTVEIFNLLRAINNHHLKATVAADKEIAEQFK